MTGALGTLELEHGAGAEDSVVDFNFAAATSTGDRRVGLLVRYDGWNVPLLRSGCAPKACLVALFASAACAPNGLAVRVSALRDPNLVGRTYWLVPGEGGGDPNNLEYRAFAALADRALRARGYQPVDRTTEPHLVIRFDYGIGPPASAIVGLNAFRTSAVVTTAFTSWVRLRAVDGKVAAAGGPAREVWTTTAMTDAPGRDLQGLIPILLAGAMDFFGANAPRAQRVHVPYRSQRVAWLAGGVR